MNENETGSWADKIFTDDPFANTDEPVETPDEVFDTEERPTYSEHMMPAIRRERAAGRDRLDSDSGPDPEEGWCISCGGAPHRAPLPGCLARAAHPADGDEV